MADKAIYEGKIDQMKDKIDTLKDEIIEIHKHYNKLNWTTKKIKALGEIRGLLVLCHFYSILALKIEKGKRLWCDYCGYHLVVVGKLVIIFGFWKQWVDADFKQIRYGGE